MNEIFKNILALAAWIVGIPAYLYGCYELAKWSFVHMWVQATGYWYCTNNIGPKTKICNPAWYDGNVHWGMVCVIMAEAFFTYLVIYSYD